MRIKTRFLSTLSHELRSPLFVVMGYAQLIADGTFGAVEADVENGMHKINKQGTRLSTMIANLLDISQLDSGQFALALWAFDRRAKYSTRWRRPCQH